MGILDYFQKKLGQGSRCGGVNKTGYMEDAKNIIHQRPEYTPGNITTLMPNEVFVFGSNLKGAHGGGAARLAVKMFGAKMGQGVGLQGQSYAIPTMQGGIDTIRPYVDEFIDFACQHKNLCFYVTRIGCGIAGFSDEDIAPLFKRGRHLDNVVLPKSFCRIIDASAGVKSNNDLLTHAHGITKTLADILSELNKEGRFATPDEAISALDVYFDRFRRLGDDIAFLVVRILNKELYSHETELFKGGVLDTNALRARIFNAEIFVEAYHNAYFSSCKERVCNLICYLNTFRRYTSSTQIYEDLYALKVYYFNHCDPNEQPYFFSIEYGYPLRFFIMGLEEHWWKMSLDGVLDSDMMMEVMFNKHERDIRRYGLEKVIRKDYISDGPCHPEVYFPKEVGTGPVYVKIASRRYVRSCGEGKGPHRIPYESEFILAEQLLAKDHKYQNVSGYWIPKSDYSLPVFGFYEGLISFDSDAEKKLFIESVLNRK